VTGNKGFDNSVSRSHRGHSPVESPARIGKFLRIVALVPLSAVAAVQVWANPSARATIWGVIRVGMQCVFSPLFKVCP
jgi:hypothetical protein